MDYATRKSLNPLYVIMKPLPFLQYAVRGSMWHLYGFTRAICYVEITAILFCHVSYVRVPHEKKTVA